MNRFVWGYKIKAEESLSRNESRERKGKRRAVYAGNLKGRNWKRV